MAENEPDTVIVPRFAENPFDQLARELLLLIVYETSDLATLWSLSKASRAVSSVVDDCGREIVQAIMDKSEPTQIRSLIAPITLLRLGIQLSPSLDDFRDRYVTQHRPSRDREEGTVSTTHMLLPECISPLGIRSILETAYRINRLTHMCLQHLLTRCNNLEPLELVGSVLFFLDKKLKRPPEGRRYPMRDVGPPSWVEEKRIARAFWYIQLFYDLKNACGRLHWAARDKRQLQCMDIEQFFNRLVPRRTVKESILTVMMYLSEATNTSSIDSMKLEHGSYLQLPQPSQDLAIVSSFPEEEVFDDPNSDVWGASAYHLDSDKHIPGISVPLHMVLGPPIPWSDVSFESFRRFGFAVWDMKRMYALGLGNQPNQREATFSISRWKLFFKYRSLLPLEEIERAEHSFYARNNWGPVSNR